MLTDLYNHTGLEVSFQPVEMCKSMSHRVFPSFIQVEFRNLRRGDSSLRDAYCCLHLFGYSVVSINIADRITLNSFNRCKIRNSGNARKTQVSRQNR